MIVKREGNLFIVKLYKEVIVGFDMYDKECVAELFKEILITLKNKYGIRGLCNIDVYTNDYYGMIIEIDNLYQYSDEIDVKIRFHIDAYFMVEIQDIDMDELDCVYYYKKKYYAPYDGISDSTIVYKDYLDIINKGIRVK